MPDPSSSPPPAGVPPRLPEPPPERWRPRVVAAVIAIGVCGVLLLAGLLLAGPEAALLSLLAAALPVPVLVALVLAVDRFQPEPPRMLVLTFLWGATTAVVLAGVLNAVGMGLLALAVDPDAGLALGVAVVAPVVEEALKAAAVLAVFWWRRREFTSVLDGLVYAAMVGIGFAVSENALYYLEALRQGEEAFAAVVVLRGVFSPFAHPLFTAMFGIGLAAAAESARWRAVPALLGLAGAVLLHAVWNAATLTGPGFVLVYVLVFLPLLAVVVSVAVRATRREGRILREELAVDVERALLTGDEVDKLASARRRRRAERDAARSGGPVAKRHRRAFHHAATQLALTRHRRRTGRGRRVPSAEAEAQWVGEVRRTKELAGLPVPAEAAPNASS